MHKYYLYSMRSYIVEMFGYRNMNIWRQGWYGKLDVLKLLPREPDVSVELGGRRFEYSELARVAHTDFRANRRHVLKRFVNPVYNHDLTVEYKGAKYQYSYLPYTLFV